MPVTDFFSIRGIMFYIFRQMYDTYGSPYTNVFTFYGLIMYLKIYMIM